MPTKDVSSSNPITEKRTAANGTVRDWVWNPIQGGGWRGQKPEILSQNITSSSLKIVSVPVHWASGKLLTECQMEEKITLDGDVAHIHYTFRNTGRTRPTIRLPNRKFRPSS